MTSTEIVLISGINGYIASHIGLQLLQKGYIVRGTSRSASAKDKLLSDAFQGHESQYQHYLVPDITTPGAFDEAVKGVSYILHTASPVIFTLTTVDDFFIPAVEGNLCILNSALRHAGPQLKSFVLTSSIAAIGDKWKNLPDHHYTEEDWNTSGEAIARDPATFTAGIAYGASKAAAERAMWDFKAKHNPPFAFAAVNPGVVTGPPITWPETPDKLNTTLLPVWDIYAGTAKSIPPQIGAATYIDVRDTAALHIWVALNPEKSNGQRYLATNGKAPPQAIADVLRKKYPERDIIVGEPGQGYVEDYLWVPGEGSAKATKAYEALGVERFTGFEKSIIDTAEAFEKHWPGLATNFKQ
jgi:nucleoside-diphosphate-sugar epimerase